MLFSATQTRKIEDLARISLKKEPLYIGVDDAKDKATVEGLEQVNFLDIWWAFFPRIDLLRSLDITSFMKRVE